MTLSRQHVERILGFAPEITEYIGLKVAYGYPVGYPRSTDNLVVGKGRTIEAALEDLIAKHWEWMRKTVYAEQGGCCNFCGDSLRDGMELDHIELRSHGRSDERSNLRGLDSSCHQRRHRPKAIIVQTETTA